MNESLKISSSMLFDIECTLFDDVLQSYEIVKDEIVFNYY